MCYNFEPKRVDFENMLLTPEEEEEIQSIRENCAAGHIGHQRWCESKVNYHKVFLFITKNDCKAELERQIEIVDEMYSTILESIGIDFDNPHYQGKSWIERAFLKQLYY